MEVAELSTSQAPKKIPCTSYLLLMRNQGRQLRLRGLPEMELLKLTGVRVATEKPFRPKLQQVAQVPTVLLLREITRQELLDTTRKSQLKASPLLLTMDQLEEVAKKLLRRFTDEPKRQEITHAEEALTVVLDLPRCNNNAWYTRLTRGKQSLLADKE